MRWKAPSNRFWFSLHGWAGAQLGVALFVVLFSGSLATVAYEIDWLLNPAIRVTPDTERVDYGRMAEAVRRAYPARRISYIHAPVGDHFAAQFVTEPADGGGFDPSRSLRVYVNPYSGEVQGATGWFNVQRTLRDFHMNLSLPAFGIYLVSAFGFLLLTSLVSALCFYKRWWRRFFALRRHKGRRVFWSDLHRAGGLWSLWFTGVMAVTGIWYFIEMAMFDLDSGLADIPGPWPTLEIERDVGGAQRSERLPLEVLAGSARAAYPGLEIAYIYLPADPASPVHFTGHGDALLVRDRANNVFVDPYDASVVAVHRAEDLPLAYRWVHTADPLHFGDFGGLTTKLIWFAFGLISSGLTLTGTYLWFRRHHRRHHSADLEFG